MIPSIVADRAGLDELCARVRDAGRVALDTEFHAERTYSARLMVVQLAFDDGAVIVDALALTDLRPLVLALTQTTVVGHALSADLKIFADRYSLVPSRVFDTQIAASFLGYGMQISLADLVRSVCDVRLSKSQTVSDWSARPFSERQIEYLVDDVVHLLPVYDALLPRLEKKGRYEWVFEECAELGDIERYRMDERRAYLRIPGAMRMSRRELGILNELVKLRDAVARERDLPVRYVLPDDVVAGLAATKPTKADDFAQLRRFDGGMKRQLGPAILAAVARGQALPEDELPQRPRPAGGAGARRPGFAAWRGDRGDRPRGRTALEFARAARRARAVGARDSAGFREFRTRLGTAAVAAGTRRRTALADAPRRSGAEDRRLRQRRSESTIAR